MEKIDNQTRFLIYTAGFLLVFNIALSFSIPVVLQLLGLIALCFMPGFLLCSLFNIKATDYIENFLYYVGVSVVFDILFGLIMNAVLPIFGESRPLSLLNQQVYFSIILSFLIIFIIYFDRVPAVTIKIPKILNKEKAILMLACIIVILFQIGTYLINQNSTYIPLMIAVFFIPVLLTIIIIYHDDSRSQLYPLILYLICFSLIMELALRSNYIIGVDSHHEYYFFYTTLVQSIWIADPSYILGSAIGISILPTICENFLKIEPQLLFKIFYPILFSFTPLIIFTVIKKYTSALLALIASCFFIFQKYFIQTTSNSRTFTAIFFFALMFLVLSNHELSNAKKFGLAILFIIGTIFTHYTTSFLMFLLLLVVYIIDLMSVKPTIRKRNRFINLSLLVFFIGFMFFWYHQIIDQVFESVLKFSMLRIVLFQDLIINNTAQYHSRWVITPPVLLRYANITRYIMYIFMGIGVSFSIYHVVQKKFKGIPVNRFALKINKEIVYLGCISLILLFFTVFFPTLFFGYDTTRVNQMTFVILPIFLVTGVSIFCYTLLGGVNKLFLTKRIARSDSPFKKYIQSHPEKVASGILLFLLIPHLFVIMGFDNQYSGGPYSILLNSPKYAKNMFSDEISPDQFSYTYDQDAISLHWINEYSYSDAQLFGDSPGNLKITSITGRKSTMNQQTVETIGQEKLLSGYVFITVLNDYYSTFIYYTSGTDEDISLFNEALYNKNKIFSNGAIFYK